MNMMRRILFILVAVFLCAASSLFADENVRKIQARLKQGGFYFGELSGVYDSDTAAAVSRYQIRNGLSISGQLDQETGRKLGIAIQDFSVPSGSAEAWRHLRKSDQQFLEKLKSGDIPPPQSGVVSAPATASSPTIARAGSEDPDPPAEGPSSETRRSALHPTATPAHPPPPSQQSAPVQFDASELSNTFFSHERLRDYVGAFVLAELDPRVGSELEFFAEHVEYFDEGAVDRPKIRKDIESYNQKWPERRFWLAGDLRVEPLGDSRLRVSFPLRYELRNRSTKRSGQVQKTLVLEQVGDDFQIVAVNERKTR